MVNRDSCNFTFDDRERDLRDEFVRVVEETKNNTVENISLKRLNLADILIEPIHPGGAVLVERKRVDDLMASLFDGRLVEQCRRLKGARSENGVRTVLIIEGVAAPRTFARCQHPEIRYRHFLKVCVQLSMDTNAPTILRSTCIQETALFLLTLYRTLNGGGVVQNTSQSFPRRTQMHPFVYQLCATRGISERRAHAVLDRFGSVRHLIRAWHEDRRNTEHCLAQALENKSIVRQLAVDLGVDSTDGGCGWERNRPQQRNEPVGHKQPKYQFKNRRTHYALAHVSKENDNGETNNNENRHLPVDPLPAEPGLLHGDGDLVPDKEHIIGVGQKDDNSDDHRNDPCVLSLILD